MRSPEAARRVLDSKWGSSSGAVPCTAATGTTGASDEDAADAGTGGGNGKGVDEVLVVVSVPEPVAWDETTPTRGTLDDVDTTAAAIAGGGIGEADL